jgi:hypothetical protein
MAAEIPSRRGALGIGAFCSKVAMSFWWQVTALGCYSTRGLVPFLANLVAVLSGFKAGQRARLPALNLNKEVAHETHE